MREALSAKTSLLGEILIPCSEIFSISFSNAHGSTTTPEPITDNFSLTIPDGSKLSL